MSDVCIRVDVNNLNFDILTVGNLEVEKTMYRRLLPLSASFFYRRSQSYDHELQRQRCKRKLATQQIAQRVL
jgi:hypothetical protein